MQKVDKADLKSLSLKHKKCIYCRPEFLITWTFFTLEMQVISCFHETRLNIRISCILVPRNKQDYGIYDNKKTPYRKKVISRDLNITKCSFYALSFLYFMFFQIWIYQNGRRNVNKCFKKHMFWNFRDYMVKMSFGNKPLMKMLSEYKMWLNR